MMTENEWDEVYDKAFNNGLDKLTESLEPLGREIVEGSRNKYVPVEMIRMVADELKK